MRKSPIQQAGLRQAGFALVVVLWTVAILALLVTSVTVGAGRESRLTTTLRDQAIGRAAADGVVSSVIMEYLRAGAALPGMRRFGGLPVSVALEDLSGRINPNVVPAPMLMALLVQLGVAPQAAENLAAAIVDWRSPGLRPSPHGAKAAEYRAAGRAYGPLGRPFESLDELGDVLGMNPVLLAALKPHLTLWTSSDPDPAYADALVLVALRASGAPPFGARGTEARVMAIRAAAHLHEGEVATRRAVIRFGFSPDGRAWRILEWDDGDAGNE
ncbi:MAG TPA: type II secretion system protein GspK [Rhodopila sp.]|nr:type II secretion system protein GspK [Rhodopila sp.]